MSLSDMAMFSDAHASPEIPVIAANSHQLVHPSKLAVWAVDRPEESLQRINYSMAALFLGNPGISRDIHLLDQEQFNVVKNHLEMFRRIDHLLLDGTTRIITICYHCRCGDCLEICAVKTPYCLALYAYNN